MHIKSCQIRQLFILKKTNNQFCINFQFKHLYETADIFNDVNCCFKQQL